MTTTTNGQQIKRWQTVIHRETGEQGRVQAIWGDEVRVRWDSGKTEWVKR